MNQDVGVSTVVCVLQPAPKEQVPRQIVGAINGGIQECLKNISKDHSGAQVALMGTAHDVVPFKGQIMVSVTVTALILSAVAQLEIPQGPQLLVPK